MFKKIKEKFILKKLQQQILKNVTTVWINREYNHLYLYINEPHHVYENGIDYGWGHKTCELPKDWFPEIKNDCEPVKFDFLLKKK